MQFRNTKHISESAVDNARSHYYIIQTMKRSAAHVMPWIFEAIFRAQRTLWKEANEEGGTML